MGRGLARAVILDPFDLHGMDGCEVAAVIADKFRGLDGEAARVVAPECLAFFLAVIEAVDFGPLRPRIVRSAFQRRSRDDLQLQQALAAMTQGRADTVGAVSPPPMTITSLSLAEM